jgi:hypothetical protein
MRILRKSRRAWALAVLLGLGGCYKATFYQNANAVPGARHEHWTAFFIFGLVGTQRIDVREFCGPDELAEVRTGGNFATGLVSAVTIGIYTPRKVYVTCAAKTEHVRRSSGRRLELALDTQGRPVTAELHTHEGVSVGRIAQTGASMFRVSGSAGAAL